MLKTTSPLEKKSPSQYTETIRPATLWQHWEKGRFRFTPRHILLHKHPYTSSSFAFQQPFLKHHPFSYASIHSSSHRTGWLMHLATIHVNQFMITVVMTLEYPIYEMDVLIHQRKDKHFMDFFGCILLIHYGPLNDKIRITFIIFQFVGDHKDYLWYSLEYTSKGRQ